VPFAARAQAPLNLDRPVTTGVQLPPATVAGDQNALSLALNPAGLAFGPWSAAYLHEEAFQPGPAARRGDALFANLGGMLPGDQFSQGLALGIEWLRNFKGSCTAAEPCLRRTSLAYSLGSPVFALGGAWRFYQSDENPDITRLGTLDLGVIFRPASWLSVGLTGQALNAPNFGSSAVARRYTAGLALRPVAALTAWSEATMDDARLASSLQLSYGLRWAVVPGLEVLAQAAHALDPLAGAPNFTFTAGLRAGLGFAAATVAAGAATGGADTLAPGLLVAESTSAAGPMLFGAQPQAHVLDLEEALSGPSPLERLLGLGPKMSPYQRLLLRLSQLADDPSVGVLVLEVTSIGDLSLGRVEELRGQLATLRARGAKVLAWLESGGDTEYYLATAADRIYAAPQALLQINGLASERIYLRGLLDKVGVAPEFVKIGKYKSAPEQYTRTSSSEPAAEMTNSTLDDEFARYVGAVAAGRRLSPERVRTLLDRGLWTSEQAAAEGLIDGTATRGEGLGAALLELAGRRLPRRPAGPAPTSSERWGPLPRIGLVEVVGAIGASPGGALGEGADADRIVAALDEAARDEGIGAIVVRIDSPGGDVAASERIWHAVSEARKKKPVVASMGDVAASGGYYVAVGADVIFAEPSTLTGSIGVFAGKVDASALLARFGVDTELFARGERADFFTPFRPWTPGERAVVEGVVEAFYEAFLQRVAAGRRLSRDEVHELAQGRVWTGAQARERRLVDSLGGLDAALREARKRAGLPEDAAITVSGTTGLFTLPTLPPPPQSLAAWLEAWRLASGSPPGAPPLPGGLALWQALVEGRPLALAVDLPAVR
jgi:protease-4